jgi:hypothetical protein
MIVFMTRRNAQYTVREYVRSHGAALGRSGMVVLRSYERLLTSRRLRPATYIFSDLERLEPDEAEHAAGLWQRLADRGGCRLLNHPTRTMRRYEILRTLYERGSNRFNVYRATESRLPERFPVFLRRENDHDGSRTPLLDSPAELRAALDALDRDGVSREDALITEFCDTRDARGLYRKYAAFRVGDHIIPRHLFFRNEWMVKGPNHFDDACLEEERAYLAGDAHDAALREIFDAARIEYGRADYGVVDGQLQIWEINTNPMTASMRHAGPASRARIQADFGARFRAALEAIDVRAPERCPA